MMHFYFKLFLLLSSFMTRSQPIPTIVHTPNKNIYVNNNKKSNIAKKN